MSIWTDLGTFISSVASNAFSAIVESVRTVFEGDAETRKQVSFSIAIIALSAKMAKADGVVTEDEVEAFKQIFEIPPEEGQHVASVYNLAKRDVAGFDSYARQIKGLFPDDTSVLLEVIDGLFHIAKADGLFHPQENRFLEIVADIFEVSDRDMEAMRLRHFEPENGDPYTILNAERDWDDHTLRAHYRKLVRENHPDRLIARGVPKEFLVIATERLAAINAAWELIERERKLRDRAANSEDVHNRDAHNDVQNQDETA